MNGLVWVGDASSVVFSVNSGSGNMQIKNIKVTVSVPSGIHNHLSPNTQKHTILKASALRGMAEASM
jgi:hypothetical protein